MNKSKGFNLIEILVALVVISISLFAVARVQISGMQGMETAKESTSSAVNITNLIERLSKQRDAIRLYLDKHGSYSANQLASDNIVSSSDACPTSPISDVDDAQKAIGCEIDAWASSMVEALGLTDGNGNVDKTALAYGVTIEDQGTDYKYTNTIKYKIPRITIAVMWKKNPGAELDKKSWTINDKRLMTSPDVKSELGYMSMEYIAP